MAVQACVLHLMGRVWTCSCGTVRFWVGDIWSPELSQQMFDWYTPSHIVHGILFYGLLHLLLPRVPRPRRGWRSRPASRGRGRSPRTRPG